MQISATYVEQSNLELIIESNKKKTDEKRSRKHV